VVKVWAPIEADEFLWPYVAVLLHGRGGAMDEVAQGWFSKPWISGGILRAPLGSGQGLDYSSGWVYNGTSAWGAGYFARYSASPHAPPPSSTLRGVGQSRRRDVDPRQSSHPKSSARI
jgi:hypothetical protein